MCPIEPVHALLGAPSNSSIAASVTVFGQPVIEPPGKRADRAAPKETFGRSSPLTPLTRCWTVGKASIRQSDQYTEPVLQTLPKSCLSRSTSMRCSAISFSDDAISSRNLSSSARLEPRARVPFMGRVESVFCCNFSNLSGLAEATDQP